MPLRNILNNHEIKIESLHKDNNYSPNKFIVLFTIIAPNLTADNYISHYKLLETINGPDTFSLNDDVIISLLLISINFNWYQNYLVQC